MQQFEGEYTLPAHTHTLITADFIFNLYFNDQINSLKVFFTIYIRISNFLFCQILYMPFITSPHHLGLNLFSANQYYLFSLM